MSVQSHPLEALPYVRAVGGEVKMWEPGDLAGCDAADACVEYMAAKDSPSVLLHTARAIMAGGVIGVAEVAFFHRIAELAILGAASLT